ncbi:MAG: hypothetical protein WC681_12695 [Sterolibacterium sp.]|jgi:hypothetical protein
MPIKLFQIFKTGRHTDGNGITRDFAASDLQSMAAGYSPQRRPAPLVLGHPENQDTAQHYGEVARLIVKGSALYALSKVSDALVYLVRTGAYRYVSPSFSLSQPSPHLPGTYSLRSVGFLGGWPPAVKGMPPLAFAEGSGIIGSYTEIAGLFDAPADFTPPTAMRRASDAGRLELHRAAMQIRLTCPAITYAEAIGMVEGVLTF